MRNKNEFIKSKVGLLKQARLTLLQLHKLFVDAERREFEKINGEISSSQFLNLLVNDANFQWLRKFSILIVEIDEMFDLKDGHPEILVEKYLSQILNLINHELADESFEVKYNAFMRDHTDISIKHNELKKLLIDV